MAMKLRTPFKLSLSLLCLLSLAAFLRADDSDQKSVLTSTDKVVGLKQTAKAKPNVLSAPGDYGGDGNDEPPASAIDGDTNTKYFNHVQDGTETPGVNTGLVVTPTAGPTIVTAIQFAAANDVEGRDPVKITLEGSNDPKATEAGAKDFAVVYEGPSGLEIDPGRTTFGKVITFDNKVAYQSYRLLITATRATDADSTQYAEVKLLGKAAPAAKP
ncbi:MAG: hypothetical protein ABIO94_12875 [Opitutaceae bacterium]